MQTSVEAFESCFSSSRNEAVSKQPPPRRPHELVWISLRLGAGAGALWSHELEGQLCQRPLRNVNQVKPPAVCIDALLLSQPYVREIHPPETSGKDRFWCFFQWRWNKTTPKRSRLNMETTRSVQYVCPVLMFFMWADSFIFPAAISLFISNISLVSDSLSRFIVVPHKVLDTELKKSFAHFNEGRIPVSFSTEKLFN